MFRRFRPTLRLCRRIRHMASRWRVGLIVTQRARRCFGCVASSLRASASKSFRSRSGASASGAMQWRWKGVPAPRPLYNLDKLAASPDAPVVVVEGEKSADAAARVFPKSVATTSPGGSQAASKADWTPLAGRRVLDLAGRGCAGRRSMRATLAETLAALGCEVSIIDAMALAATGSRWLEARAGRRVGRGGRGRRNGRTLPALRKAAVGLAKPFEPAPAFVVMGCVHDGRGRALNRNHEGQGRQRRKRSTNGFARRSRCSARRATRMGETGASGCAGAMATGASICGTSRRRHCKAIRLRSPRSLAGDGLRINRAQQRALASYLCGVATKGRVTMVSRTGWHSIGGRDVFVLPGQIIGPRGAETVILDGAAMGRMRRAGRSKDWQAGRRRSRGGPCSCGSRRYRRRSPGRSCISPGRKAAG